MNEPSRCNRGLSLIDVLWVMTIIFILLVIVLVILPRGSTPPPKTRIWNANNMKQIVLAFATEARDDPRALTADRIQGDGNEAQIVRNRLTYLAGRRANPFPLETLVNLVGTDTEWSGDTQDLWPTGEQTLGSDNLSYALIDHRSIAWRELAQGPGDRHQRPPPRIEPIIADKQVGGGSHWNADAWEGQVGWADGHVTWHSGPRTTVQFRSDQRREDHDIFTEAGDGTHNRLVNP